MHLHSAQLARIPSPCHTLTPNYHQRKNALKRTSKSDSLTAQCTWLHAVMAKIVPIHMCFPLYRSSSSRVYMQNAVNMDFQQIISGISCSCRYRTCLKCMENVANVASVKCVCVLLPHLLHPPCVPMSQPYVMRRPNNICTTAQRVHCTQILANLYASVHRKISASNINYCRNSMMTISMGDERRRALILYVVLLMSIVSCVCARLWFVSITSCAVTQSEHLFVWFDNFAQQLTIVCDAQKPDAMTQFDFYPQRYLFSNDEHITRHPSLSVFI